MMITIKDGAAMMMNRVWGAAVGIVLLALGGCGAQVVEGDVAFVDVTVIPMDREQVLEHQTVVVQDGRIAAMGSSADITVGEGTQRIDGAGRFLIPGLAEMHAHLGGAPPPNAAMEQTFLLYVANGVTSVRGMATGGSSGPALFAWRDQIEQGRVVGPDLIIASPSINSGVSTPEEADELVRQWAAEGYDLVKLREGPSVEVFDATAAAAREVGIPIGGHVSDRVGLRHTLAARPATMEHLDNYVEALVPEDRRTREVRLGEEASLFVGEIVDLVDESQIPELMRLTKESGTYVAPSMVLWDVYLGGQSSAELLAAHPEVQYVRPQSVESWVNTIESDTPYWHTDAADNQKVLELRRRILQELHDADVPMILAADTPGVFSVPGFGTHHEMEFFVEAGLTPYETLETATRRVAEYLNATDEFGTVAVGQRANLVLLTANPLEDIGNAARRAGVMLHGRWHSEEELQARLAEIAATYGQ